MPDVLIKSDPCPECGHLLGDHRFGTPRDDGCYADVRTSEDPYRGCGCRFKAAPHPDCLYSH